MEKRVIIAFVLSFAVLYGFRSLFSPSETQQVTPPPRPSRVETKSVPEEPAAKPQTATPPETNIQAEKSQEFVFDTTLYTATVSNAGAVLKSFKLKAYSDSSNRPIELINETAGAKVGWPLAFVTADEALNESLAKAPYVGRKDGDHLVLEFAASGLHARKILQFGRDNYEFSLETTLTRDGKPVPHAIAWQGDFGDQSIKHDPAKKNVVYQMDQTFRRVNLARLKDPQDFMAPRAGIEDQYFVAVFLTPDNASRAKVRKQEYPGDAGAAVATLFFSLDFPDDKPTTLYVGPKQREWLTKADAMLPSIIDYGWFGFVAKPLVFCLLLIHTYIGNFGVAIILLTLGINLILFPLRLKQQVSMQKMAKIQPHMRRIQDQMKKLKPTDPRRSQLQNDMMSLYREHGVNPMGGCLPLLLQMPVLFGFYSALYYSIELRRAPFLWINDLSQADWVFGWIPVLPILMAVSMFIMQKLTPTTVDPAQAKMMMIMPLMFTVLFVSQSSGLVLYWLTSNVAGIAQQVFINKYWSPQADAKLQARTKPKEIPGK